MQLIYRINRTGTTVVVATHDREMVDKMRRRVIELREGRVIRDQTGGTYSEEESTVEFAARLRTELGIGTDTFAAGRDGRRRPEQPLITP
jgi:cell division transport system ATP-binding protein